VLVLLLLPFLFLLWMTTWVAPPHQEQPDTFALNPKFDQTAPLRARVYRWTVSAVPVSGADVRRNRMRVVVNGRSPGPLIEANAHDRILVNAVLFLGLDFSKFFLLDTHRCTQVYMTNGLQNEGTYVLLLSSQHSVAE
jgi:hypothetical protein